MRRVSTFAFILLSLVFSFSYLLVLAYDPVITHPALTVEIAQFYNALIKDESERLTAADIMSMRQGAIEEDEPPRWINHFYDPIHQTGWTGNRYGRLEPIEGIKSVGDLPRPPLSLPMWAVNQEYQASYGVQFGNQTWQKAIASYLAGDREKAFIALGHILHLVEDASVPDHTRDDSHPHLAGDPGSPYEVYSKNFTTLNNLKTAEQLLKGNSSIPSFSTLAEALTDMAVYSNNNFFSEDTIDNNEYSQPDIRKFNIVEKSPSELNGDSRRYLSNNDIYLAFVKSEDPFTGKKVYSVEDKYFVMPSYVQNLFPRVVLTGAGVINLFFKEVKKYQQDPGSLETIVSDVNVPWASALFQRFRAWGIKTCELVGETCTQKVSMVATVSDIIGDAMTPKVERAPYSAILSSVAPNDKSAINLAPGASTTITVQYRNYGTITWTPALATIKTEPISGPHTWYFKTPTWVNDKKVALLTETIVPMDNIGTFKIPIVAPLGASGEAHIAFDIFFPQATNIVSNLDGKTGFTPTRFSYTITITPQTTITQKQPTTGFLPALGNLTANIPARSVSNIIFRDLSPSALSKVPGNIFTVDTGFNPDNKSTVKPSAITQTTIKKLAENIIQQTPKTVAIAPASSGGGSAQNSGGGGGGGGYYSSGYVSTGGNSSYSYSGGGSSPPAPVQSTPARAVAVAAPAAPASAPLVVRSSPAPQPVRYSAPAPRPAPPPPPPPPPPKPAPPPPSPSLVSRVVAAVVSAARAVMSWFRR